jgi:hypothetical protein
MVGSFLFILLATLLPLALQGNHADFLWTGLIFAWTSWIALSAAIRLGTVRAVEITNPSFTLTGVAGEFKCAVDEMENG